LTVFTCSEVTVKRGMSVSVLHRISSGCLIFWQLVLSCQVCRNGFPFLTATPFAISVKYFGRLDCTQGKVFTGVFTQYGRRVSRVRVGVRVSVIDRKM